MEKEIDWIENKSDTHEITARYKGISGYTERKIVYRFWQIDDGDWKLQIVDSEDSHSVGPVWLPKRVIDTIIKAAVKEELKK
jgi:hypothetical protein